MALIHVKHPRFPEMARCGYNGGRMGRGRFVYENYFIDYYNDLQGRGICSKCADLMIKEGKIQVIEKGDSSLMQVLREKTQDLRVKYINQTESWASSRFDSAIKVLGWSEVGWCEFFGLVPRIANKGTSCEFKAMPENFYNTRNARIMDSMKSEARRLERMGKAEFIKREKERAERHYEDSLAKLIERLVKKGVSKDSRDVKIVSGWVGVNFEVIIEVHEIRVKAWTIIASGPVQRPHYRYLVK